MDTNRESEQENARKGTRLILADEAYAIIGAAMEVHNYLESGFLESVYQEALELELNERGISFQSQAVIRVHYKQHTLSKSFLADILVFDQIIVEIKALRKAGQTEEAQLANYLNASGKPVGLPINYGSERLERKRLVGKAAL